MTSCVEESHHFCPEEKEARKVGQKSGALVRRSLIWIPQRTNGVLNKAFAYSFVESANVMVCLKKVIGKPNSILLKRPLSFKQTGSRTNSDFNVPRRALERASIFGSTKPTDQW